MLKKLLSGELSLGETFWKFGVLGFILINLVVKVIKGLLVSRLKGLEVLTYYTKYFSFSNIDTTTLVLTILYLASLVGFVFYSYMVLVGTWRSSAEYNKSLWLRFLSRFFVVLFILVSVRIIF